MISRRPTPLRLGVLAVMLTLLLSACAAASLPVPATPPPPQVDVTQEQEAGELTVKVTWHPDEPVPTFDITLDTHSIDLEAYDLGTLAVLRTEAGELQPEQWSAPTGGHHRSGRLVFPPTDSRTFELVIRGVGEVPERTFSWRR
jgi:hypothetical protein